MNLKIASNLITLVICAVNFAIQKIVVALITWVGYDTHSVMLTKLTNGVFLAQFTNSSILLLIEASFLRGPFKDYSDRWFAFVGSQIVKALVINTLQHPIAESFHIVKGWFKHRLDQKWARGNSSELLYKT